MQTRAPDSAAGAQLTLQQWASLAPEISGELIHGELVEEELADYVHDVVVGWLITMVGAWALPRRGLVAASDAKFGVSETHGRKPDATLYLKGEPRPPGRGLITVPPTVAIEVVSPTPRDARRDRVDKLREYATFGVRYYWIVDPQLRSFEVLELDDDGRYVHARTATDGAVEPPPCEGLSLDLDALWSLVDDVLAEA